MPINDNFNDWMKKQMNQMMAKKPGWNEGVYSITPDTIQSRGLVPHDYEKIEKNIFDIPIGFLVYVRTGGEFIPDNEESKNDVFDLLKKLEEKQNKIDKISKQDDLKYYGNPKDSIFWYDTSSTNITMPDDEQDVSDNQNNKINPGSTDLYFDPGRNNNILGMATGDPSKHVLQNIDNNNNIVDNSNISIGGNSDTLKIDSTVTGTFRINSNGPYISPHGVMHTGKGTSPFNKSRPKNQVAGFATIEDFFNGFDTRLENEEQWTDEELEELKQKFGNWVPGKPFAGMITDKFVPTMKTEKGEEVKVGAMMGGWPISTLYKVLIDEEKHLWFAEEDLEPVNHDECPVKPHCERPNEEQE